MANRTLNAGNTRRPTCVERHHGGNSVVSLAGGGLVGGRQVTRLHAPPAPVIDAKGGHHATHVAGENGWNPDWVGVCVT